LIETFLIFPDLTEALGRYPNIWVNRSICSYFTQMFLILPKTLLKFFSWLKFDEDCWNYHMIPIHSRALFILPSLAKEWQNSLRLFCRFGIFYCWFGYYFALTIDTTSLTCECCCILCPNFENFCPNNGQIFSVGDATASLHPRAVRWCVCCVS